MKKLCLLLFLLSISLSGLAQGKYKITESEVTFFSEALIEDISATNQEAQGIIDFEGKQFLIRIPIKRFIFPKSLMQEHFNENYLESDKYPNGIFKGTFAGSYNLEKDGEYALQANGELEIHGKTQTRSIPTKLMIKNGQIWLQSVFMVQLKDHKIKIPKLLFNNIAEEIEVKISCQLVEI